MTLLRITCLLLFACSIHAAELPGVPPSDRILTTDLVKNYWLNIIPKMKLPEKGNGLHPEQQAHRAQVIRERKDLMSEIRRGDHDTKAKIASLSHNVRAYSKLGDEEKAKLAEERLFALQEHLSRLATLKAQRDIARKLSEATDKIASLESEISSLEQTINNQASIGSCD